MPKGWLRSWLRKWLIAYEFIATLKMNRSIAFDLVVSDWLLQVQAKQEVVIQNLCATKKWVIMITAVDHVKDVTLGIEMATRYTGRRARDFYWIHISTIWKSGSTLRMRLLLEKMFTQIVVLIGTIQTTVLVVAGLA